jgi:hypothetical protein
LPSLICLSASPPASGGGEGRSGKRTRVRPRVGRRGSFPSGPAESATRNATGWRRRSPRASPVGGADAAAAVRTDHVARSRVRRVGGRGSFGRRRTRPAARGLARRSAAGGVGLGRAGQQEGAAGR